MGVLSERLTREQRERLIAMVKQTKTEIASRAESPDAAAKQLTMSSFALAALKRGSVNDLFALLDSRHASTASQKHWQLFADIMKPCLQTLITEYREPETQHEATLFMLGWLHRFAKASHLGASQSANRQPNREQYRGRGWEQNRELSLDRPPRAVSPPVPPPPPLTVGEIQASRQLGEIPNSIAKYRQGDRIEVTIVEIGNPSKVQMPDGLLVPADNLFGRAVGDQLKLRVIAVTREGVVKRLQP
jgi:hypothetical protein